MPEDGRIIIKPTKPERKRCDETLSMRVARHLDPILKSRAPPPFHEPEGIMKVDEGRPGPDAVSDAIDRRDIDLLVALHLQGAPLDEPDKGGFTPLANAISNGCTDMAEYIISQGVDHKRKTGPFGYLTLAAVSNRMRIGKLLLETGEYSSQDAEHAARVADENGCSEFSFMIRRHFKDG